MRLLILIVPLLITSLSISARSNHILSEREAFDYFLLKKNDKRKDFVVEYMYKFNNEMYKKYRDDEFLFESQKQKMLSEMVNNVKDINTGKTYIVYTGTEFGKYDFEKNEFEFNPLSERSYFKIFDMTNNYYCGKCETLTSIGLQFMNWQDIDGIKMDSNKAKKFIQSRKNSSGSVNRDVSIKIFYEIAPDIEIDTKNNEYKVMFNAVIKKVDIYDGYGYKNSKGSQKIIASIIPNSQTGIAKVVKQKNTVSPEIQEAKDYIQTSLLDDNIKQEIIAILDSQRSL